MQNLKKLNILVYFVLVLSTQAVSNGNYMGSITSLNSDTSSFRSFEIGPGIGPSYANISLKGRFTYYRDNKRRFAISAGIGHAIFSSKPTASIGARYFIYNGLNAGLFFWNSRRI